jgi:hypothetical protein
MDVSLASGEYLVPNVNFIFYSINIFFEGIKGAHVGAPLRGHPLKSQPILFKVESPVF